MTDVDSDFSAAIASLNLSSDDLHNEGTKKVVQIKPSKQVDSDARFEKKISILKNLLASRSLPEQNRALIEVASVMKEAKQVPGGEADATLTHFMRADIISFMYAEAVLSKAAHIRSMVEFVSLLLESSHFKKQNNAPATLDFLLRWIYLAASLKAGKGLYHALILLGQLMLRLSKPPNEFRRLMGAAAIFDVLDAICSVTLKPKGHGGWMAQICVTNLLTMMLAPQMLGVVPDVALVRSVIAVQRGCHEQLATIALVPQGEEEKSNDTEEIARCAVSVLARQGEAAVWLHETMTKNVGKSFNFATTVTPEALSLYRETVLTTVLENFLLVFAPFIGTVIIEVENKELHESFLLCEVAMLKCPVLSADHAKLANSLAKAGHLQLLAVLFGFWSNKPGGEALRALIVSALVEMLSALAAIAFDGDSLRESLVEGTRFLPSYPVRWFHALTRSHTSEALRQTILVFAYFYCLTANGAEMCRPTLFPALVKLLNGRYAAPLCTAPSFLLTKIIWFTFAACCPLKGPLGKAVERATDTLTGLLERVNVCNAFTAHPVLVRWACTARVPSRMRREVMLLWLHANWDKAGTAELVTILQVPLAANAIVKTVMLTRTPYASERCFAAIALALEQSPQGVLAAAMRTKMPRLVGSLLTCRSSLDAASAGKFLLLTTMSLRTNSDSDLTLATATALASLVSRAMTIVSVPLSFYAAALSLALEVSAQCPTALTPLTRHKEFLTALQIAAGSSDSPLCEAALRLITELAAVEPEDTCEWSLSLDGNHALTALGSSAPTLVMAVIQLLYMLLPESPPSDDAAPHPVSLDRPPDFLRALAQRSAAVIFKFRDGKREICAHAWLLLSHVLHLAVLEKPRVALHVATSPSVLQAARHCRVSRQSLNFFKDWIAICFSGREQMDDLGKGQLDLAWETLVAISKKILDTKFGPNRQPLVAETIQEILDRQLALEPKLTDQLHLRLEELQKKIY